MITRTRHLATSLALALAAAGVTVAVAGPAQALPPNCSNPSRSFSAVPGVSVTATNYYVCNGEETGFGVTIYKNGVQVATGSGTVTYHCVGSTENAFTTGAEGGGEEACG